MVFWTGSTPINEANLARLGPSIQGIVGTEGAYTDLYTAMTDPAGPQWNRVLVAPGATINGNVYKTATDRGCIIGIGSISLSGIGKITLEDCSAWLVENIRLNSTVCGVGGAAIKLIGAGDSMNMFRRVDIVNSNGMGFHVENASSWITNCIIETPASHGINITAAVVDGPWIDRCRVKNSSGGWGIMDQTNDAFIMNNIVLGNSSGQISSTSTYKHDNKIA